MLHRTFKFIRSDAGIIGTSSTSFDTLYTYATPDAQRIIIINLGVRFSASASCKRFFGLVVWGHAELKAPQRVRFFLPGHASPALQQHSSIFRQQHARVLRFAALSANALCVICKCAPVGKHGRNAPRNSIQFIRSYADVISNSSTSFDPLYKYYATPDAQQISITLGVRFSASASCKRFFGLVVWGHAELKAPQRVRIFSSGACGSNTATAQQHFHTAARKSLEVCSFERERTVCYLQVRACRKARAQCSTEQHSVH